MEKKKFIDIVIKVAIAILSAIGGALTQACTGMPLN